ncbi:hypothetical protein LTR56_011829 [Elasticomyces elasticus]|nr:hypothetical protein LTR56_011829 [Elasticomyces elasticus]KAK3666442.1 hypothetical protein LTR22_002747 [Elasticomyces elasticus]KAK4931262.1 hypothetical protein LTR49_002320 [Elasticomyces elasticus]KAK5767807.1 hypothetical protein LTS12_001959 [Elasticomyces elasticus]
MSLIQRLPSANTVANALTPSNDSKLAFPIAKATSLLPNLSLTPQKSSTNSPHTPSTPQQQQSSPSVSTPGQWQHPRYEEIVKRRSANRFDSTNMRVVGLNAGFIAISVVVPFIASLIIPRQYLLAAEPYQFYILLILRLFFAMNLIIGFAPLLKPKDNCDDVPLTPSQRQLLGLPPMSRPATPQEQQQYVTPPRYSRSTTPQSNTSSLRAQTSGSPLNGRPLESSTSQLGRRSVSGSPGMGGASPLAYGGLRSNSGARRTSFQSSPLSTPEFDAAGSISTPTKSGKASVGLNSKWLYEKGRGSPRSSFGGLGGFGGGGSVFN